jgi:glycosyltransferase involved in cell wall biosynthesis
MKLQILVPHYDEPIEVIKPLLDSISIQQNVDFGEIGVIICNDGKKNFLEFPEYPFKVEIFDEPHRGVSGTRNACLDHATAEYVMFCDADDMFMNACGLYILFREINGDGFDTLVSAFVEETRDPKTKEPVYVNHDMDTTFVHGKVHRRQYLLNNNIRWNEKLTIHEDSYFNCLCQRLSKEVKYCQTPFYLWRWRDESVCRHDPKYLLKTYNNMLDSMTSLVLQFISRRMNSDAQFYATTMIYDAYFTLNKDDWINQENKSYKQAVEDRFRVFYEQFRPLFMSINKDVKAQIIMTIKNRMYGEGLLMEHITFDDWIKQFEK